MDFQEPDDMKKTPKIRFSTTHPAVAATWCPYCNAVRGVPCRSPGPGYQLHPYVETHLARVKLYEEKNMNQGRCVLVTLQFEDGSHRIYRREHDNYILMADSPEQGIRNISMAGSTERNVVLLKILDSVITKELMGSNVIGPDVAKEGESL